MRRLSYADKDQFTKGNKISNGNISSNYLNQSNKLQLRALEVQSLHSLKNRYNHHPLLHKNKISPNRPLTTNRTFSFSQTKKQDISEIKAKISQVKNEQKRNQLLVSTVKQDTTYIPERQHDVNKGKLIRGSSWRQEKKKNLGIRRQTPLVDRYSPTKDSKDDRTSTQKTFRFLRKGGYRNHIMDLIGRNLQKSHQPEANIDHFFEYVMRFSYRTRKGYIPSNPNKVNQDSFIINPNINKKTWQHFFAVCDGHGPYGHFVSSFIKNNLGNMIAGVKGLQNNPKQALEKGFSATYQKLIKQSKIDLNFSGSTINSCYFFQNKLYCSNVGDSRAIVGKQLTSKKWKVQPLSIDHKPNLEHQANRIRLMNGRVEAFRDQYGETIGPLRVWVKDDNVPGLAMTRSFGDLVAASVGVSPQPQIKEYSLAEDDKIILIASDGVYEFLRNEQLIQAIVPFYQKKDIQQASDFLLNMAHRSWMDNSSIIDDITFILIFLHYNQIN